MTKTQTHSMTDREKHHHQLRQMILDCSYEIVQKDGWDGLTMRKISSKIGYTLPIIYRYFKSKNDIISAIASEGFQILTHRLLLAVEENIGDPRKILTAIAFGMWNFYNEYRLHFEVMYGLTGVSFDGEEPLRMGEELFDTVSEKVYKEIAPLEASINDTQQATEMFWATIHGFISLHSMSKISNSEERASNWINQALEYYFKAWGI